MNNSILKIGDTVLWSGTWGTDEPVPAKVTAIEVTHYPRDKYGTPVPEVEWSVIEADRACLTLDNGHWCYASQIAPVTP